MTDTTIMIESLPPEILGCIFQYLPISSVKNCVSVSKKWRDIAIEQFRRGTIHLTPSDYELKLQSRLIKYVGNILVTGFSFQSENLQESNPCEIFQNLNNREDLRFTYIRYSEPNFIFHLKPSKHLEMTWYFHFSPKLPMWSYFFSQLKTFENIQGLKMTIWQRCGLRKYEKPMSQYLLKQEELVLPASFTEDDYLFKNLLEKLSNSPESIRLRKLYVTENVLKNDSQWIHENIVGTAFSNLEEIILTSRCQIIPKQENGIYEVIVNTQELKLKYLDLRRSCISIDEVNEELQAKAVTKLVTYKNTVNHKQAHAIMDEIFVNKGSLQKTNVNFPF